MVKRRISKKPTTKVSQKQKQTVIVHINNGGKGKGGGKRKAPANVRTGVSSYEPHIVSRPIIEMYAPQNFYNPNQQGNPLIPTTTPVAVPPTPIFNTNDNDSILKSGAYRPKVSPSDVKNTPLPRPVGTGPTIGHLGSQVAQIAQEREERIAGGGGIVITRPENQSPLPISRAEEAKRELIQKAKERDERERQKELTERAKRIIREQHEREGNGREVFSPIIPYKGLLDYQEIDSPPFDYGNVYNIDDERYMEQIRDENPQHMPPIPEEQPQTQTTGGGQKIMQNVFNQGRKQQQLTNKTHYATLYNLTDKERTEYFKKFPHRLAEYKKRYPFKAGGVVSQSPQDTPRGVSTPIKTSFV